jgi:hypothetical protein
MLFFLRAIQEEENVWFVPTSKRTGEKIVITLFLNISHIVF